MPRPRQPTPDTKPSATEPRKVVNTGLPPHAPGAFVKRRFDALELPHERDEGLETTASEPDPVIEQAGRDLASGQVDTDLRATPGLDAQRRERLLRRRG
ncbi:MAG: hypothetical protein GTN84_08415 [Hydrogenophaga sp.]|uniref:hypothetical protein n=1 Tax=Hydrogenophaga sp. TaxID=1904254 RepID=UPI001692AC0C|nr:hypothetical protein [Hydrogenophaga sp.]NIM41114.1 hypothetical protein [Hydrogenophaga sp.]NIN26430.1 hypothetical protein [Hydrogenophaga sp.]NIN31305.1 hypothetical protein [Hydrogenophaga sp.]NIN55360.1 hypothetical protein [Hydrogenophaga sp.]NIO51695.1 hypothetical protein [Hydrogenophaga sp.]